MAKYELEPFDKFARDFENYENNLASLELSMNNVANCHTQTSINLALISLWLELDYAKYKFEELRDRLAHNGLYAFCNTINFQQWSQTFRRFSEHIPRLHDQSTISDELFALEVEGPFKRFKAPTNCEADDFIFSMLYEANNMGALKYSNYLFYFKELKKTSLPKLNELRQSLNTSQLYMCIKSLLQSLSNILNELHREIYSPSINSLELLYAQIGMLINCDIIETKIKSYSDIFYTRPDYIDLLKKRMDVLLQSRIIKYCDADEWKNLFDWEDNDCQPIDANIGKLIHKQIDNKDKITNAKDIVELTEYWLNYNWELINYRESHPDCNLDDDTHRILKQEATQAKSSNPILIKDIEVLMEFETVISQKILGLIKKSENKGNWDIVLFVCKHYKIVPEKCSRNMFSKYLISVCPALDDEKKLRESMEKCSITCGKKEIVYSKFLKDDLAREIDLLISPFAVSD